MVFKQRFKYLTSEKINFIKVILKLECLFYHNILFYIRRAILTQIQKRSNRKKNLQYEESLNPSFTYMFVFVSTIGSSFKELPLRGLL